MKKQTDVSSTAGNQTTGNVNSSPAEAAICLRQHNERTCSNQIATGQSENHVAHNVNFRTNVVCQETRRERTETHEVVTSLNSLYQRFFLTWDRTNLTVQLNPVVEKDEVYDMKLVVCMATCLQMTNNT